MYVCVGAAEAEVLGYYQQGITVVKATLLFDCLPPDARPPGVALHFRTYLWQRLSPYLFRLLFSAYFYVQRNKQQQQQQNSLIAEERADMSPRKYCKSNCFEPQRVDTTIREDAEVR